MPINKLDINANKKLPVPADRPTATAQKIYVVSTGSLIALLKRTMDKAPTIPKDKARLLSITIIITPVTTAVRIITMAKF